MSNNTAGELPSKPFGMQLNFPRQRLFRKALERAEKAGAIIRDGELITLDGLAKPTGQPYRVGDCPSVSDALDNLSPPISLPVDTRVSA
jgi:hypothetical protein